MTRDESGLRLQIVSHEATARPGWTRLDWRACLDELPVTGTIDRIYVEHALQLVDEDLVTHVLASWRDHPGVSTKTLMAVVSVDDRKGHEDLSTLKERLLWKETGTQFYTMARDAGWGVSSSYNLGRLQLDGWPVPRLHTGQFGSLCRALK